MSQKVIRAIAPPSRKQWLVGLLIQLMSPEPLSQVARSAAATVIFRLLKTPKALNLLEGDRRGIRKRPATKDRGLRQAMTYEICLRFTGKKRSAKDRAADIWSVEPGTISDAVTKYGDHARELVTLLAEISTDEELQTLCRNLQSGEYLKSDK